MTLRERREEKKKRRAAGRGFRLETWATVLSLTIIAIVAAAFLVVIYTLFESGRTDAVQWSSGILVPVLIIIFLLNRYFVKYTMRFFIALSRGINEIANGNLSARMDESEAGIFKALYKNFNKMGEELENVNTLRVDFANNYSHEFKTPITSIKGFAELLLETDTTEEERNRYLRIISDEAARLADLSDNVSMLSKLDSQQIVPEKEPYQLDEQLRQSIIILESEWGAKDIDITSHLPEVTYKGNSKLMQHIWINLIGNAIKYTPEGGRVNIVLAESAEDVTVQITDTGVGMDEETLRHVFEKYYQAEDARTKKGLGLGLSIAKRIANLCDGDISVQSSLGHGSTFTVVLPKIA